MCRKFPDTPVIIDHLCRIGVDGTIADQDVDALCAMAKHKRVMVKVGAFYALGKKEPPYTDLGPMIREGRQGVRRQAAACGRAIVRFRWSKQRYQDSLDLVRKHLDFLTADDRDWLLRRTAENFSLRRNKHRGAGEQGAFMKKIVTLALSYGMLMSVVQCNRPTAMKTGTIVRPRGQRHRPESRSADHVGCEDQHQVEGRAARPRRSATPIVWGDQVFIVTAIETDRVAAAADLPKADPTLERKTHRRRHTITSSSSWRSTARPASCAGSRRRPRRCRTKGITIALLRRRLADHRRQVPLRLLRLASASIATTSTASCSGSATWADCTRASAGAKRSRRSSTAIRCSSTGTRKRTRPSSASTPRPARPKWQTRARREDLVEHAARRRAQGPNAGHRQRHQARPQLRPRDRQGALAVRRHDASTPSRRRSPPTASPTS